MLAVCAICHDVTSAEAAKETTVSAAGKKVCKARIAIIAATGDASDNGVAPADVAEPYYAVTDLGGAVDVFSVTALTVELARAATGTVQDRVAGDETLKAALHWLKVAIDKAEVAHVDGATVAAAKDKLKAADEEEAARKASKEREKRKRHEEKEAQREAKRQKVVEAQQQEETALQQLTNDAMDVMRDDQHSSMELKEARERLEAAVAGFPRGVPNSLLATAKEMLKKIKAYETAYCEDLEAANELLRKRKIQELLNLANHQAIFEALQQSPKKELRWIANRDLQELVDIADKSVKRIERHILDIVVLLARRLENNLVQYFADHNGRAPCIQTDVNTSAGRFTMYASVWPCDINHLKDTRSFGQCHWSMTLHDSTKRFEDLRRKKVSNDGDVEAARIDSHESLRDFLLQVAKNLRESSETMMSLTDPAGDITNAKAAKMKHAPKRSRITPEGLKNFQRWKALIDKFEAKQAQQRAQLNSSSAAGSSAAGASTAASSSGRHFVMRGATEACEAEDEDGVDEWQAPMDESNDAFGEAPAPMADAAMAAVAHEPVLAELSDEALAEGGCPMQGVPPSSTEVDSDGDSADGFILHGAESDLAERR